MQKLIINLSTGVNSTKIESHWAYYIGGSLFIVLTLLSIWFIIWSFKNKNNYYVIESERFSWFKEFWYKNRPLLSIIIFVICFLSSIVFFLAAAGALK